MPKASDYWVWSGGKCWGFLEGSGSGIWWMLGVSRWPSDNMYCEPHTDLDRYDRLKGNTLKEKYHKQQNRRRHTATRRLERVVYNELGRTRDYPHAHFFIKGTANNYRLRRLQEQLIQNTMTELWERFGTIDFKANSNTRRQAGYGYKEQSTQATTGTFNHICSFLLWATQKTYC